MSRRTHDPSDPLTGLANLHRNLRKNRFKAGQSSNGNNVLGLEGHSPL
jgi:hypothetical protein